MQMSLLSILEASSAVRQGLGRAANEGGEMVRSAADKRKNPRSERWCMERPFRGIEPRISRSDMQKKARIWIDIQKRIYNCSCRYERRPAMMLAKWGNSLAVRIPSELVEELKLKPGEKVRISRSGEHGFVVERDRSREEAL